MRTKIILAGIATCLCFYTRAQNKKILADTTPEFKTTNAHLMDEVVVTGQYAPNTEDNAVQKVQVIDRKKIDAIGAQNLRDVLTNQLNVRLSQDPILGSGMSLQGISGEDVKILIDGVPVIGRQNGNIDLSQIDLNNIDRIEVIEGPMAVSYGTDALAGTINLITKKSQSGLLNIGMSTYYESMGTYNLNGRFGIHKKKHTLILSGGRNFFSGWNPGDKPSLFDLSAHTADDSRYQLWKPREQYLAGLQYTYTIGKTTISYSGSYFQEQIINRGHPAAPYGENTFDGYYHTQRISNTMFLKSEIAEHKFLDFFVSYNTYKNVDNTYYVDLTTLNKSISNADGEQDTSKFHQLSSRATFSTSNANKKINYETGYDINLQIASGSMMKAGFQNMGDYALFTSAEYKPFGALTIRPGLRYSYNTDYNAPLIPSVNTLYKINDNLKLRASYSRGFRAPSLQELYFYFVDVNHDIRGNPNLKAENSNNYTLTATYTNSLNSFHYKAEGGLFYNDIRNLITLAQKGSGNEYTYINIGKYRTEGLQVNGQANFNHFNVSLGGSYTGTYNQLTESAHAPSYSYSPELRSSIYYDLRKEGIRISFFYKYTGKAVGYTIDATNTVKQTFIDPYSVSDASISKYIFKKYLNISVGCKNLFNVQNVTAFAAGTVHTSASDNIPISTGRYYFVKLDLNLNSKS
ncbi:MAG: TonB-dependent receptor [Flavipsychrobacter sp.]|nr:TonB-dependent receptor [Flavipsychrobacter sp.]